jgi:glucose/mannose transport system permease protein
LFRNLSAKTAAIPMVFTVLVIFVGCTLWTVLYSFTNSRALPVQIFDWYELFAIPVPSFIASDNAINIGIITGLNDATWVGTEQYDRLWGTRRWNKSIGNIMIFGACSMAFSLIIGFLLAALMDQKIRFENAFRTIILYPFALSFIVTGLVWQWILNPRFGVQGVIRGLAGNPVPESFDGTIEPNVINDVVVNAEAIIAEFCTTLSFWSAPISSFRCHIAQFNFDPLNNPDIVVYGLLIAALWQGTGLVMCLMLAGIRGIDEDIWKASRIEGIPMWKTYIMIVIPMMRPVFITSIVIIGAGIVKVYDLVVAQTSGGPGVASQMPALYVMDKMFKDQNLSQGFAASTMMLLAVVIILVPWAYFEFGRKNND